MPSLRSIRFPHNFASVSFHAAPHDDHGTPFLKPLQKRDKASIPPEMRAAPDGRSAKMCKGLSLKLDELGFA